MKEKKGTKKNYLIGINNCCFIIKNINYLIETNNLVTYFPFKYIYIIIIKKLL